MANCLQPPAAGEPDFLRRTGRLWLVFTPLIAVQAAGLLHFGTASRGPLISILVQTAVSVIAARSAWGASRRSRGTSRAFWFFLGLSLAGWVCANAVYAWGEYSGVVFAPHSFPATLYRFYAIPIVMLLLLPEQVDRPLGWTDLLDFLQITILTLLLYSGLFYVPARTMAPRDIEFLNLVGFTNTQNVILLCAALGRYRFCKSLEFRRLLKHLLVFLGCYAVVASTGNVLVLFGGSRLAGSFDLVWSGFYMLAAILGAGWMPAVSPAAHEENPIIRGNSVAYNATLATLLTIVVAISELLGGTWHSLGMCAVVVSVVVYAARLSFTERSRQRAAEALLQSEQQYRYLFAKSPQPMWVFDAETLRFLDVNEATLQTYGYSRDEFMAMTLLDIRPAEDGPTFLRSLKHDLATEIRPQGVWRHKKKNGVLIQVEITASRITFNGRVAILSLIHDVTERRLLEEQLRQSQKMEAVGLLAGGIAHDFNNLLNVILGYLQLIPDNPGDQETLHRYTTKAVDAARRAANLVRQLLAFSRKQLLWPRVLKLDAVITEMGKMLPHLLGERVEIVLSSDADLGPIKVDESQMEQVILNIAVNARDAMPEGGTLTIAARNHAVSAGDSSAQLMPPGDYVSLIISDTGCGMDQQTMARIFDPFFTTKEKGKGTGLGLAIVYGIVKQSGGFLEVSSTPGQGTSFQLFFPRVAEKPQAADKPVPSPASASEKLDATVLVVEDEDALREATLEYLKRKGCEVLAAHNGEEALTVLQRSPHPVKVMVTDIVMPKMSGDELASRAHELYPEIRIVFVSGYNDELIARAASFGDHCAFLPKPYAFRDLTQKIREGLDGKFLADRSRAAAENR